MTEQRVFTVGGHSFVLRFPRGFLSERELAPYIPFVSETADGDSLFTLTLTEDAGGWGSDARVTADLKDEYGCLTVMQPEDGGLAVCRITPAGTEGWRMRISGDYMEAEAWIGTLGGDRRYALDTVLMMLYTFSSASMSTLLLHASAVELDGKGYLFLGKSGTGKSTHSRLWTEHVPGTRLLNDDNPIIRLEEEGVHVYGSPWSGKTPCYRNRGIPLAGIVRLNQAASNRMAPLSGVKAYAALLPSCSCMRWDHRMCEAVHSTVERVIGTVPVYCLECRPDRGAAELCLGTILDDGCRKQDECHE